MRFLSKTEIINYFLRSLPASRLYPVIKKCETLTFNECMLYAVKIGLANDLQSMTKSGKMAYHMALLKLKRSK